MHSVPCQGVLRKVGEKLGVLKETTGAYPALLLLLNCLKAYKGIASEKPWHYGRNLEEVDLDNLVGKIEMEKKNSCGKLLNHTHLSTWQKWHGRYMVRTEVISWAWHRVIYKPGISSWLKLMREIYKK